ncbi:hypothetical protein GPECTOR_30g246 [Gonium pectorale]|uniref:Uncharacterized protein n=1 Tax=Gonium pectorale TaxID=33097 RepID=A0A150GFP9_GONPE|nr:hypothetical protein GPECTOR_30g246 [Gonium pectorale]|eukprot:KXZ48150.1 hypothetical protein GPECTOR_30g246 [Gonium pectorale]
MVLGLGVTFGQSLVSGTGFDHLRSDPAAYILVATNTGYVSLRTTIGLQRYRFGASSTSSTSSPFALSFTDSGTELEWVDGGGTRLSSLSLGSTPVSEAAYLEVTSTGGIRVVDGANVIVVYQLPAAGRRQARAQL